MFKVLLSVLLVVIQIQPAFADELSDLKAMVQEMKSDFETKINDLEAKIEKLETRQDTVVEGKVSQMRTELKEEIKKENLQVEYVGRHNAPVGDGGVVIKNPHGFGDVTLGGYADMEYHDMDGAESTFRQHRWIINLGAQLGDRLRFNSEFELEYGGSDAEAGDGESKVEQAYIDYLINEKINLRAGALLVPFGRFNLIHDSDEQELTERPILARDIIPTTWTEAGYGFFGEFNPAIGSYEDLVLQYELYAVNGLDAGFSDTGLGGARSSLKTDNNDNKAIVGRVVVSPQTGQELGVSGYWGRYDDANDNALSGVGVDSLNTFGPFEFINEYAYFGVDETPSVSSDLANYFQGAYSQLNYHFWPKFLSDTFLGRGFNDPTFTLVGRYDWGKIHDDSDSGVGNNQEDRYTIGLNYRPVDSFVVKFEYQFNDTDNETLEAGKNDGFITSVAIGF